VFEERTIDRALFATGWEGTIAIDAAVDCGFDVRTTRGGDAGLVCP
jgi:hypothetical protein